MKFGFLPKERTQRYRCTKCRKTCSDAAKRTFGTLRSDPAKILTVVELLVEGMGIRGTSRVTKVHRDTVLRILKFAGGRAESLLRSKLVNIQAEHIETDEIWTFVQRKQKAKIDPEQDTDWRGDYYTFLGVESKTKLMFIPVVGKRTEANAKTFMHQLRDSVAGRFQLTTDGFKPYATAVHSAFGKDVDFAQFYKEYNMLTKDKPDYLIRWQKQVGMKPFTVRCGNPNPKTITTAHVERTNLTLRITNKRFNRDTICFSKDEDCLHYSTMLFVAHYNFCKTHSALGRKTTPAMASGLESSPWNVENLLQGK